MLFCATGLWAVTVDGINYSFNSASKTASVISGDYYEDVTIPSTVTYEGEIYNVTSILHNAFEYCYGLTSITIPNSVTKIGYKAFIGCQNLLSAIMPAGVTEIEEATFSGCTRLQSVTIPSNVTTIGWYAFSGCKSLQNITIPSSVTTIGGYALNNCDVLTSISVDANNTQYSSIDGALYNKEQTKLILCPAAKTSIAIPQSLISIENDAFTNCKALANISVDANNTKYSSIDGVLYNKEQTNLILCPLGKEGDLVIPNGVKSIGSSLEGRYKITSITIPEGQTNIVYRAFADCSSLTMVTISNSVTSIGAEAFEGCSSLEHINVTEGNANYISVDGVLYSKDKKVLVRCPNAKTSIEIPNSVTSIGSGAFSGCTRLTSIAIPNSVKYIGEISFYNCKKLTDITIPSSVMSISDGAFSGCSNIETADINSQAALDAISFTNKLTNIKLGDKITSIGNSKFQNCANLTSVTIPSSVTNIGTSAFAGCSGLAEIICEGETPAGSNTIFGEGGEAGKIYVKALLKVPSQWLKLYKVTEPWCRFDMTALDSGDAATAAPEAEESIVETARYDINGRPLNAPTKGVNIVKFSDGSFEKEFVK